MRALVMKNSRSGSRPDESESTREVPEELRDLAETQWRGGRDSNVQLRLQVRGIGSRTLLFNRKS